MSAALWLAAPWIAAAVAIFGMALTGHRFDESERPALRLHPALVVLAIVVYWAWWAKQNARCHSGDWTGCLYAVHGM